MTAASLFTTRAALAGRLITFEGIDGAGKSTHIEALAERFRASHGADRVVCTREPGGTALAEALRSQLLHSSMDALTEALVVFAARRDHVKRIILPAMEQGQIVLCDRFTDATFAYQGGGRGFDLQVLAVLETWVQEGLQPDLTLWFDLPPQVAAKRRAAVRTPDRFEQQDTEFFDRVRQGYLARMEADPGRFVRLDAAQSRDSVWSELQAGLDRHAW